MNIIITLQMKVLTCYLLYSLLASYTYSNKIKLYVAFQEVNYVYM